MLTTLPAQANTKQCSQCQQHFNCSGCAGGHCWCMAYPPIFSCGPSNNCLCPQCLTKAIQAHINTHVDNVQVHSQQPAVAAECANLPLLEQLDYTIDAQGRWVLSRWHLLKRGSCCGNRCTNCPYGYVNVVEA